MSLRIETQMKTLHYTVRISHCANPDIGDNGYWGETPPTRAKWLRVNSIEDAARECRNFIALHELGAGNWNGGQIRDPSGKTIGRISFNGSVFDMNDLLVFCKLTEA
jgi:hypothetical protein